MLLLLHHGPVNPGQCEDGGKLDCCVCKRVLNAGGATLAATAAIWACVRMRGDMLIVGSALCSHAACHSKCVPISWSQLVGQLVCWWARC